MPPTISTLQLVIQSIIWAVSCLLYPSLAQGHLRGPKAGYILLIRYLVGHDTLARKE